MSVIVETSIRQLERIQQRLTAGSPLVVREASEVIVATAKQLAPVDTGELRESIVTMAVSAIGTAIVGGVEVTAGHAAAQEFGDAFVEAQPYLRPAVEATANAIEQGIARGIEQLVDGAMK